MIPGFWTPRGARLRSVAAPLALLFACQESVPPTTRYLEAAVEAGRWLQALAATSATGYIPDVLSDTSSATWDVGSGAAGRALFFLELFAATDDSTFLRSAETELQGTLASIASQPPPVSLGFYNGISGVAFALSELFRSTGMPAHRESALVLARQIADARTDPDNWPASDDVLSGTAGIGLGILSLARAFEDSVLYTLATRLGDDLLERRRDSLDGSWWSRSSNADLNLPNFSHGTAGVGYFLAALHLATGVARFEAGASSAAAYVIGVADDEDGLFLVPYGIPDDGYVTKYDIGWAHGPAGTANLFVALGFGSDRGRNQDLVSANVKTLLATGMPAETSDPQRWASTSAIDRRFGTSGAAVFLTRFHRNRSDPAAHAVARAIADDIIDRGSRSEQGMHWEIPRYGFQGDRGAPASFTGFLYGVAGLGLALLELHYTEIGTVPRLRWPDDAFALNPAS